MKKDKIRPKPSIDLRKRAEELLRNKLEDIQNTVEEDNQELIHELEVYQIELEMQNEELRKAQAELEESRNKYFDLYELAPIGYFTLDKKSLILEANLTGANLLGVQRRHLINKEFTRFVARDFQDAFYLCRRRVIETSVNQTCELKLVRKDGTSFHAQLESIAVRDAEGSFSQLRTTISDLTDRKRAEQQLRETRDYAASIVDTIREPLVVLDADLHVISANRSFYQTFKVQPGETEGLRLYDLGNREWDIPELHELLEVILPTDTTFDNFEMEQEFKTIGRRVMHLNARRIYRENNETHFILLAIEDVTERKRAEKRIHDLAYYDGVTRLPNRQLFREHLSRALAYAKRHKRLLALLFLDLDHFKHINDTLGHHVGDLLLWCVADRLKKILRQSDLIARHESDDSTSYVSRFGGDEFVLLLTDLKQPHDAANVAQRALQELSKAFVLEEREIFVSSSIGISLYPSDGKDVNTLIKNADAAMYHAKKQGRNIFQFYAGDTNTTTSRRLTLDSALRKALEHAELTLYYQPQLDINSDKIVGTEALIRWRHPELGAVSPTEFIPLAEEAGLIEPINEWVLRTACSQNLAWQAAGFPPMRVAVNFSNLSFKQNRTVKTISRVLRDIGMEPQLLEIEITEGTLVRNDKETIRALEQLKELGICVAIDDFGTGHFSLYHLRHYPLDAIKIDRCFIKDIGAAQDSTAITTAIIAMASGLQLRVIAEGVETQQQLTFLRQQGCDEMQGFLFSRPVPSNDISQLLSTGIT